MSNNIAFTLETRKTLSVKMTSSSLEILYIFFLCINNLSTSETFQDLHRRYVNEWRESIEESKKTVMNFPVNLHFHGLKKQDKQGLVLLIKNYNEHSGYISRSFTYFMYSAHFFAFFSSCINA